MTYSALAAALVALAVWPAVVGARRLPDGRERSRHWAAVAAAGGALVVLTAVFDNVMIAAELYEYGDVGTSGIRVGLAPIEDFAYPVACALGVPGLWLIFTRRPAGGIDG